MLNPTNADLGPDIVHTLTINDDDSPPVIDFNLTSSSGDEATTSKTITVNLSTASSKDVTVNYAVQEQQLDQVPIMFWLMELSL